MAKEPEASIANLTGDQLIQYLNTLSQRQAAYSKLKIQKTEELIPVDQQRAALRAEIQNITERMKQTKLEVAACKYGIRAEKD
jgi:hypothetical protein